MKGYVFLVQVEARAALRSLASWALVAFGLLFGLAAISLDVFGFDGVTERSVASFLGSVELVGAIAVLRRQSAGPLSGASSGFRDACDHLAGPFTATLARATGSALGTWLAFTIPAWAVIVFYNLWSVVPVSGLLVQRGVLVEWGVVGAWAGLGSRLGGRVVGATVGLAAVVLGRLAGPSAVHGLAATAVSVSPSHVVPAIVAGLLTILGASALTNALPRRATADE